MDISPSFFLAGEEKLTLSALYISLAIVFIFSSGLSLSSYKNLSLELFFSIVSITVSANFEAPLPPSFQCSANTAFTPFFLQTSITLEISSSVSVGNLFSATTVGIPNFERFSKCLRRLGRPSSTAFKFSSPKFLESAFPCNFKALTVATTTAHDGDRPVFLHLILINFSAPKSAPNPASVTT